MEPVKLFLSHASEDQPDFVRPLAEALSKDFKVWYSEYELTIGDRLLTKIDEGLRTADYGIVVLSPHFFAKRWPREELEGLFQLETTEKKVILPIWRDVSLEDVKTFSPILAGRIGADSKVGISKIVEDIKRAVGLVDRVKQISSSQWKNKLKKLDNDIGHLERVKDFFGTEAAVTVVRKVVTGLFDQAWIMATQLAEELTTVKLRTEPPEKRNGQSFSLTGPKRLVLHIYYQTHFMNSLDGTELLVRILRNKSDFEEGSEIEKIEEYKLKPSFDKEMKVFWANSKVSFSSDVALLDFAFDRFVMALTKDM